MFFKKKNKEIEKTPAEAKEIEKLQVEIKLLKQELDSANIIIESMSSLMLALKHEIEVIKKNVMFDED